MLSLAFRIALILIIVSMVGKSPFRLRPRTDGLDGDEEAAAAPRGRQPLAARSGLSMASTTGLSPDQESLAIHTIGLANHVETRVAA